MNIRRFFTRRTILPVVLGLGALVAFAGFKHTGGHCRWSPEARERMVSAVVEDTLDDLDATDAQRTKVNALKTSMLAEAKALHSTREQDHKALMELWSSENPDATALHALVDQRVDAARVAAHKAADAALELHKTLTPEQRDQLLQKVQDRMDR